jgi:hypothetical protein
MTKRQILVRADRRTGADEKEQVWKGNGAQGWNRTLAYPTESPSFFEWLLSSVPTSGPGAFFAARGATLCRRDLKRQDAQN